MGNRSATISREEAASHLVPGRILYLRVALPPEYELKDKYFVVVGFDIGFDNRPLLLRIDSAKSYARLNRKFREHQFSIKQSQYNGLQHDSYLDCGRVWYILTRDEVIDQIAANPRKTVVGHISKDHEREIVKFVQMSKSVERAHKKIIAASFGLGN